MMNRNFTPFCIIVFLILIVCHQGTAASRRESPGKAIYREGVNKYLLSDFIGAAAEFERVYQINSSDAENISMYYKTLVKIGDEEYLKKNFEAARRMYARAIGLVGEDENLLWRLKTIDDIKDLLLEEKQKNESRNSGILKTVFFTGITFSVLFLVIILFVYYRLKRNWSFDDLIFQIRTVIDNNTGIVYYNELSERLNDSTKRIEMINRMEPDNVNDGEKNRLEIIQRSEMALTSPEFDPGGSLLIIARIIDSKTGRNNHSIRVSETAFRIAELACNAGVHPEMIKKVALIHDIGLLNIKGKITSEEISVQAGMFEKQILSLKYHTQRGERITRALGLPDVFARSILYHHERFNGSGYPHGIKGNEVPVTSLIICAAEFLETYVYDNSELPEITSEELECLFGPHAGRALYLLILELESKS